MLKSHHILISMILAESANISPNYWLMNNAVTSLKDKIQQISNHAHSTYPISKISNNYLKNLLPSNCWVNHRCWLSFTRTASSWRVSKIQTKIIKSKLIKNKLTLHNFQIHNLWMKPSIIWMNTGNLSQVQQLDQAAR